MKQDKKIKRAENSVTALTWWILTTLDQLRLRTAASLTIFVHLAPVLATVDTSHFVETVNNSVDGINVAA